MEILLVQGDDRFNDLRMRVVGGCYGPFYMRSRTDLAGLGLISFLDCLFMVRRHRVPTLDGFFVWLATIAPSSVLEGFHYGGRIIII